VWRAFELRPEPSPAFDMPQEHLERSWKSSVYPIAERVGVTMRPPPVYPRTRRAHEATAWARAAGRTEDFHAAVFDAYYARGVDIGQVDVLCGIAASLGLDADALRAALKAKTFEPDVLRDERDAQRMGLGGVPAMVADRRVAVTGVQPVETLRQLVAEARRQDG
jgi:predicted DsbA family dithiol-disulfide isomerase